MRNYISAIKQLSEQIDGIQQRASSEIKPLQDALNILMKQNETCFQCNGQGKYRTVDAAGQTETQICKDCGGRGEI